ncbi:MAG: hypothetical protein R3C09_03190 [Pirellulaceae bacterium]
MNSDSRDRLPRFSLHCLPPASCLRFAPMKPSRGYWLCLFVISISNFCASASAQLNLGVAIDKPPINYSDTADDNRITRLLEKIASKDIELEYTTEYGYLRSLLKELDIRESSQTLVFSQTSMQVQHISRRNPRAVFFNDDTYVAWIRGSSLIEMSTTDPKLGAAFYTVDMTPWRAKVKRANYDCLGCHATSMTQGVPGHTVRSVYTDSSGQVLAQSQSYVTGHSSPLSERWGGWYVTGLHGDMSHMGNATMQAGQLDRSRNGNRTSLEHDFDTIGYLSPYSDIVALMVLEHQTQMHNVMTKADFATRQLLYDRALETQPTDEEEWRIQMELVAREVVDYLLFRDETRLESEIHGSTEFAEDFKARGPQDDTGRSLRDLDMKTRMFKFPCSYLIYSEAFDLLQEPLRQEIYRQLLAVLSGSDTSNRYAHLDATTRGEILAILRETKSDLPADWNESNL